jgi:hypothetical protein
MDIGSEITYTDPRGRKHRALVTANWGIDTPVKAVNLVYVSDDEGETDQYGRQIKRDTSVPHKDSQAAHGRYWE